jgi:hypothetical protein
MPTDDVTMWQQQNVSRATVFELLKLLLQQIQVSLFFLFITFSMLHY